MDRTSDDVDHLMTNGITAYFHCSRCVTECPATMSQAEFARLAVGRMRYGIQVWCVRHNMNIYHLDLTRQPRPGCVTHGVHTDVPYADDLDLGCPRCGFDPSMDTPPA